MTKNYVISIHPVFIKNYNLKDVRFLLEYKFVCVNFNINLILNFNINLKINLFIFFLSNF